MKFWERKKKTKIQKHGIQMNRYLYMFIIFIIAYLYFVVEFMDSTTKYVVSTVSIPIFMSLSLRIADWFVDSVTPLKLAKDNQELYDLGIITYDQYNKRKNELIEEVNSRYPYNETKH